MTDYERIYASHADDYHRLVCAEDCDGRLLPALESVAPIDGARVVEVGAGTGRLTRLLVRRGAQVRAFDRSPAMLEVARAYLADLGGWEIACADAAELPVVSESAEIAVAGWVFGHARYWQPKGWQSQIGRYLDEMERVLTPGGKLIVLETLGTGSTTPQPPSDELAEYYAWLEARGFDRRTLRTDYLFPSVEEAARVTGFFFGSEFAERVRREGWMRVPECTGLWHREKRGARPGRSPAPISGG